MLLLFLIVRDFKIQVEFNFVVVNEYWLLGYEIWVFKEEDFNNDKVDVGDIGFGYLVIVIYEIIFSGQLGSYLDEFCYVSSDSSVVSDVLVELGYLKICYKLLGEECL